MLTKRYLPSNKNLNAILAKLIEGTAPEKFTVDHLKKIGFKSSNDRAIIPLLKDLGFLNADGVPTERYHEFRDKSRSKAVMAEALQEAYEDIFHLAEKPTKADRNAIQGLFKTTHNATDRVAEDQARTFLALLSHADLSALDGGGKEEPAVPEPALPPKHLPEHRASAPLNLRYNIEIHLPPSKDIEVYNAIFRSLKENLVD